MAEYLVTQKSANAERFNASWNPFRVDGTDLPPNVLLMAKILAVAFLLTEHWRVLPDHFLPFLSVFNYAGPPLLFQHGLQIAFLVVAFSLLLNYRARACCILLASLLGIAILSSRPFFENNRTYTACLWFVAGLTSRDQKPWLVRYQVVLLYFGAGLNKLLDADWRSGQFFQNMVVNLAHQQAYIRISSCFPPMLLSKVMGWTVIATELTIAAGFSIGRLLGPIAWVGITFHTVLLLAARTSFGMFYFATLSSFLAFLDWPLPHISVSWPETDQRCVKLARFLKRFDLEGMLHFSAFADTGEHRLFKKRTLGGLSVSVKGRIYVGLSALYMALIYSPRTYLAFAIILSLPFPSGSPFRAAWAIVFWCFISPALLCPLADMLRIFRVKVPEIALVGSRGTGI